MTKRTTMSRQPKRDRPAAELQEIEALIEKVASELELSCDLTILKARSTAEGVVAMVINHLRRSAIGQEEV